VIPLLTLPWLGLAAQQDGAPVAPDRAARMLRALADSLARADRFSGVVLLAQGDRVILHEAWGLASHSYGVRNRPDTKFNIGSISKLFTTVAIRQLEERGALSSADPVSRHLSDFPREVGDRITILQLLRHESGLGDIFGPEFFESSKERFRSPRDFFPLFVDKPLLFEPGTSRRYSNAGFIVLGAIIETASGQSYFDYVREHVYRPAGMIDSDHFEWDRPVPNRAIGYTSRGPDGPDPRGRRETVRALAPRGGASAGGGLSTAPDLLRFVRALRAGRLLGAEGTRRQWQGGDWGVAGGAPGCNALLEVLEPFGDYVLIVLANYDPPIAEEIGRRFRRFVGAPVD
jgi:CubicO group peptidase (beta-lactamase class C family)